MFEAILLGIVQGLTEFIPVSSSGHLIIVRNILGLGQGGLAYDAVLQLATAFASIIYFRNDIKNIIVYIGRALLGKKSNKKEQTLILALIWGTIPAVLAGILLEQYMETIFRNIELICATLVFGSVIMFLAEYIVKRRNYEEDLTPVKGFVIGLFQCLALVPGISRSGATISGGIFSGLGRENAAKFSFLLSIPILLGTGFKKLAEVLGGGEGLLVNHLLLASITAFLVGIASIHFLMKFLKKYPLDIFIWYRIVLAVILFVYFV